MGVKALPPPASLTAGSAFRGVLAALAQRAPPPIFTAIGPGGGSCIDALRVAGAVSVMDSPRWANVLLVTGDIPTILFDPLRQVHDQLPHPRATVLLTRNTASGSRDGALRDALPQAVIATEATLGDTIGCTYQDLLTGRRPSERDLLPNVEPAPWRGVGPYGQGGMGMTGGVPYGRPLAERAPDRDGLELDQLEVRIGPFFLPFPPGLVLDVALQGDVIQHVQIAAIPPAMGGSEPANSSASSTPQDGDTLSVHWSATGPFRAALTGPMTIGALEVARARHLLRWCAHALRIHGLDALAMRTLGLALTPDSQNLAEVGALRRLLERTRAMSLATAGVGIIDREVLARDGNSDIDGPVARAAGIARDARSDDATYHALGFEPITHSEGDARARWRQRLAEAEQAVSLAARAGNLRTAALGRVESPRGTLREGHVSGQSLLAFLPTLLTGMEWGDAITTIVSLDLDLEEAAQPQLGSAVFAPPVAVT